MFIAYHARSIASLLSFVTSQWSEFYYSIWSFVFAIETTFICVPIQSVLTKLTFKALANRTACSEFRTFSQYAYLLLLNTSVYLNGKA